MVPALVIQIRVLRGRAPTLRQGHGDPSLQRANIAWWRDNVQQASRRRPRSGSTTTIAGVAIAAAPPTTLDFEDFHEDVCRLRAACDTGLPVYLVETVSGTVNTLKAFNTSAPLDLTAPFLFLGFARRSHHGQDLNAAIWNAPGLLAPSRAASAAADRYWRLRAFQAAAGRSITICDNPDHDTAPNSPFLALKALADAGHRRAFLKDCRVKRGVFPVELTGNSDAAIRSALYDALEYSLETMPSTEALLVQEHVPMTYEYRVIVVGHQPVAGAGVTTADTPLVGNPDRAFQPVMTLSPKAVVTQRCSDRHLADYLAAATRVTSEIAREAPALSEYALDLATAPDGRVIAVEINAFPNLGLYRLQYRFVLNALIRRYAQRPVADPPAVQPATRAPTGYAKTSARIAAHRHSQIIPPV